MTDIREFEHLTRRWSLVALPGAMALVLACVGRSPERADVPRGSTTVATTNDADSLYHLSLLEPRVEQALDSSARARAGTQPFVLVHVTEVTNPGRLALSFELRARIAGEDDVLLGLVSLFPADNPGRFIIPTGGRLRPDRAQSLVLTLVSPDGGIGRDAVRVTVRRLDFVTR